MSSELAVVGDVLTLLKRLEKAATDKVTSDMLEALAALDRLSVSITLSVLTKTKCGAVVNRLRVGSDPAVVQAAGSLVRKWKVVAERAGAKTSSGGSASAPAASPAKPVSAPAPLAAASRTAAGGSAATASSAHLPRLPGTRHNVRKAFIDMFAKLTGVSATASAPAATAPASASAAASAGEGAADADAAADVSPAEALAQCERVAGELELALFDALGGGGSGERPLPEYVEQFRVLALNLPRNPALARNLAAGLLAPGDVVRLDSEALASDAAREQANKYREEAAQAVELDYVQKNRAKMREAAGLAQQDGMFRCAKCKGKNTDFYQKQTRGADEPMTTFVTCNDCGNRWRFN